MLNLLSETGLSSLHAPEGTTQAEAENRCQLNCILRLFRCEVSLADREVAKLSGWEGSIRSALNEPVNHLGDDIDSGDSGVPTRKFS